MTTGTTWPHTVESDSPYARTTCNVTVCGQRREPCRHCGQLVAYVPEHRHGDRFTLGTGWTHLDGRKLCQASRGAPVTSAEITPKCPACGELSDTAGGRFGTRQTPYGIQTDCQNCGYTRYFSIGD